MKTYKCTVECWNDEILNEIVKIQVKAMDALAAVSLAEDKVTMLMQKGKLKEGRYDCIHCIDAVEVKQGYTL